MARFPVPSTNSGGKKIVNVFNRASEFSDLLTYSPGSQRDDDSWGLSSNRFELSEESEGVSEHDTNYSVQELKEADFVWKSVRNRKWGNKEKLYRFRMGRSCSHSCMEDPRLRSRTEGSRHRYRTERSRRDLSHWVTVIILITVTFDVGKKRLWSLHIRLT